MPFWVASTVCGLQVTGGESDSRRRAHAGQLQLVHGASAYCSVLLTSPEQGKAGQAQAHGPPPKVPRRVPCFLIARFPRIPAVATGRCVDKQVLHGTHLPHAMVGPSVGS